MPWFGMDLGVVILPEKTLRYVLFAWLPFNFHLDWLGRIGLIRIGSVLLGDPRGLTHNF